MNNLGRSVLYRYRELLGEKSSFQKTAIMAITLRK